MKNSIFAVLILFSSLSQATDFCTFDITRKGDDSMPIVASESECSSNYSVNIVLGHDATSFAASITIISKQMSDAGWQLVAHSGSNGPLTGSTQHLYITFKK